MNKLKLIPIFLFLILNLFVLLPFKGIANNLAIITNYNNSNIESIQKITQDTTAPIIQIINPKNQTYASTVWYCGLDSFWLEFTINEEVDWIGYSIDGDSNVTISGNTSVDTTIGVHSIIVYANDTSGNMGLSEEICFTIKSFPPSSTTFFRPNYISFIEFFFIIVFLAIIIGFNRKKNSN